MNTVTSLMKSFKMRPYNEDTGYGFLRHILVRTGYHTGQIMVVLVTASPVFPCKNNFVNRVTLREFLGLTILSAFSADRRDCRRFSQKEFL